MSLGTIEDQITALWGVWQANKTPLLSSVQGFPPLSQRSAYVALQTTDQYLQMNNFFPLHFSSELRSTALLICSDIPMRIHQRTNGLLALMLCESQGSNGLELSELQKIRFCEAIKTKFSGDSQNKRWAELIGLKAMIHSLGLQQVNQVPHVSYAKWGLIEASLLLKGITKFCKKT